MVKLTDEEIKWLGEKFPQLNYNIDANEIVGTVKFKRNYKDCQTISDSYKVRIDLSKMKDRQCLPNVYNTDNRILSAAKRKGIDFKDFHINEYDDSLCLMLPVKFKQYYPSGFNIPDFMKHLCNHLYWVSHYERYEKEPWESEKHGEEALFEMAKDPTQIYYIRKLYKKRYRKSISILELKNKLNDPLFIIQLLKQ